MKPFLTLLALVVAAACQSSTGVGVSAYAGTWSPATYAFFAYGSAPCTVAAATLTVNGDGTFQKSWSSAYCYGAGYTATLKGTIIGSRALGTLTLVLPGETTLAALLSGTCSAPTATATCTGHFRPTTTWTAFIMRRS